MKYLNKFLLSFSFASSTQIMITEKFPTKTNLPPKPIPDGKYLWVTGNGKTIYTIATKYEKKNPVFIIKYGPDIFMYSSILTTFYGILYENFSFSIFYIFSIIYENFPISIFSIISLGIEVYIYKYLNPYRFIYSTHGKVILYLNIFTNCMNIIINGIIWTDQKILIELYYFKQLKETFEKARSIHNNQLENPVGLNTLSV